MNRKYLIVREAIDWLEVGESRQQITEKELGSLQKYLSNSLNINNILYIKQDKIKIINYTGIIILNNMILEILPKLSLTNEIKKDREILLNMLKVCKKIPIKIQENFNGDISSKISTMNFLDYIGNIYCEKLLFQLNRGIYKEYMRDEESGNFLRGKLDLKKQIRHKVNNIEKIISEVENLSENNDLNRILKKAVEILEKKTVTRGLYDKYKKILRIFENVTEKNAIEKILKNFSFNRHNERYKELFNIAKYIIQNFSPNISCGAENSFSLLFSMNKLFEEYVGEIVRRNTKDSMNVSIQERNENFLKNLNQKKRNISLNPDIVLYEKDVAKLIIDTKWKILNDKSSSFWKEDIYQIYAYINGYSNSERGILLYPKNVECFLEEIWKTENQKRIEVRMISLESLDETIEDLKRINII